MSAGHYALDNLTVLIDNNRIQADGATADVMEVEPVVDRFAAFGFEAVRIDPYDYQQLAQALPAAPVPGLHPKAVVLQTVPGKGVPSFEANHKVHYLRLPAEVWEQAMAELDAQAGAAAEGGAR